MLTDFHFGENPLGEIPPWIGKLRSLSELGFFDAGLTDLPDSIGELEELTRLYLSGNQLSQLPAWIGNLKSLQVLQASTNQLRSIPSEIGQLTSLQELWLGGNAIESLPESIGRAVNLEKLSIERNRLSSLPASLGQLTHLSKLDLLDNPLPEEVVEAWERDGIEGLSTALDKLRDQPAPAITNLDPTSDPATSVADFLELRAVNRIEHEELVKLRRRVEPFLGLVANLLQQGAFDTETELQVDREQRLLEELLIPDTPHGPLAAVVHAYFSSLLAAVQPLLDLDELLDSDAPEGIAPQDVPAIVEAGSRASNPLDPTDPSPTIELADAFQALAPVGQSNRARWAASAIGWISAAAVGASTAAGAAAPFSLSWMPVPWAAVVGGIAGVAAAVFKANLKSESADS
jgi:hypothetical protein